MSRSGGGRPLDASTRDHVGARLGADLGSVRLHSDPETGGILQTLGARGLTVGQDIFGGPDVSAGPGGASQVLLHELAHVAQSDGVRPSVAAGGSVVVDQEGSAAEREAHGAAARLGAGLSARVSRAPAAARFFRKGNTVGDPPASDPPVGNPGGGGGDEALIAALCEGGVERARQMLRDVAPERRAVVERAIRSTFDAKQAEQIIQEVPVSSGECTPEVTDPEEEPGQSQGKDGQADKDGGQECDEDQTDMAGDTGSQGGDTGGDQPQGNTGTPMLGRPAGEAGQAGATTPGAGVEQLEDGDLALIYEELVEHQIWKNAGDQVGNAGSVDRAAFIAEVAGQGAISGGVSGAAMGAVMGFGGKLTARFVPVPGVGAVIGGAMSAYDLMFNRDWSQTADTIGKFGEGGSIYEVLANSIASISEIIDVAVNIMNVIAGIVGIISAVMWLITIVTVGLATPLAGTLSAIAMGISAVSGVLDLINTLILQPVVLLFRALHTFTSEADPREVEAQGAGIADASSKAASTLGGWVGGKAGEYGGSKAAGAIDSRITSRRSTGSSGTASGGVSDAPAGSRSGDAPAPARRPDAPAPARAGGDAPASHATPDAPGRPLAGGAPEVQRSRAQAEVDADAGQRQQSHQERIAAEAQRHQRLKEEIHQNRQRETADAQQRGQEARRREIGDAFEARKAQIEAEMRARLEEAASQRRRADTEVADAAHEMHLEEIQAAGREQRLAIEESGRVAEIERNANKAEFDRRQQEIDQAQAEFDRAETRRQASEEAALEGVEDPEIGESLRRQWASERADRHVRQAEQTHADTKANAQALRERNAAAEAKRKRVISDAERTYEQRLRDAEQRNRQMIEEARAEADRMETEARQDAERAMTGARTERDARLETEIAVAGEEAGATRSSELDATLADSRSRLAETRRENWRGAIREGMDHNRAAYDVQESWRPWGQLEPESRLGKVAAFTLNEVMWPFMDDLIGPWTNIRRGNLDANGQLSRPSDGNMPFSRGGNAVKSNEGAAKAVIQAMLKSTVEEQAKEAVGIPVTLEDEDDGRTAFERAHDAHSARFTTDNQSPASRPESADTFELVQTERFDPNYQDPPGTPQELAVIMDRIEFLLAERERARQAEAAMCQEQVNAEQDQGPINALVTASEEGVAISASHQQAVARRQAANQAQQQRQQEASQLISDYANRKAGVAVITGPLEIFRGFTHLASALPGDAGAAMQNMNRDATRLSEAFSSMDERMAAQEAAQPERTQAVSQDAATLDQTTGQAQTSSETLDTARQGAQGLSQANQRSQEEAAAAGAEAQEEGSGLEEAAQAEQTRYQTLSAQLCTWATQHRQARQMAIAAQAAAAARPRAFGSEHRAPVGDFPDPRSDVAFA